MALTQKGDKSNWSLKNERPTRRERGEEKREEEEEEEKKREEEAKPKRYGTTWAFEALNGFPCNCMVISCLQT